MSSISLGTTRVLILCLALVAVFIGSFSTRADGGGIYIVAGDSVAAGVGASLPRTRGFPALVRDWMQISNGEAIVLEDVAVPGETAATYLSGGQFEDVVATIEAAAVAAIPVVAISLTLGGNEMLSLRPRGITDRQQGLSQFREDFRSALGATREAAGPDVPIVVTTYYELTGGDAEIEFSDAWWIRQFNTVIRESAAEVGALVADIEPVFIGSIPEYTYYPFDVHPTNAGHSAIARAVASSLQVSGSGPEIEILSSSTASRQTPTLRFKVLGDFGVDTVQVTSSDVVVHGPFDTGSDEFVALLQFGTLTAADAVVTIVVTDTVGAETSAETTIALATGQGAPP